MTIVITSTSSRMKGGLTASSTGVTAFLHVPSSYLDSVSSSFDRFGLVLQLTVATEWALVCQRW
jgi:hypothetical protein